MPRNTSKQVDREQARVILAMMDRLVFSQEPAIRGVLLDMFAEQSRLLQEENEKVFTLKTLDPDEVNEILDSTTLRYTDQLTTTNYTVARVGAFEISQFYDLVPATINPENNPLFNELASRRARQTIKEVNRVTTQMIRDLVVQPDTNIPAISRNIREFLTGDNINFRATRIARTESVALLNRSAEISYQESGVVEQKEWLTELDDRTCQWCPSLNRKILTLGDTYFKEGEEFVGQRGGILTTYEDIPTPPIHPSCRCTTIPVELMAKLLRSKYFKELLSML